MIEDESVELRAALARERVARQLYETLTESAFSGSRDVFAMRVREVAGAAETGDLLVLRAAAMEASVAAASWVAALDLVIPAEPVPFRRTRTRKE